MESLSTNRASQACRACRRLKRKCTKELPACSLCIRLNKDCRYPPRARAAELADLDRDSLVAMVRELEHRALEQETPAASSSMSATPTLAAFPVNFFLDPDFFQSVHQSAFVTVRPVSSDILQYLGQDTECIPTRFFSTIHETLPFISQKRVLQRMAASDLTSDPTLSLLLLSMKAVSEPAETLPPSSSPAYCTAKSLLMSLEAGSAISLYLLQSVILLSLYEIGHAIYPAAYLSVGQAARLGTLMGLHSRKNVTQLFKLADTFTLREEERRTWWAVFVLERFLNAGPKGLTIATPDPCQGDLLPMNDGVWASGELGPNEPFYTTGFSSQPNLGLFARTCQSANLLGKVLHHLNDRTNDRAGLLAEAVQLHSTLAALDNHLTSTYSATQALGEESWVFPVDMALCFVSRLSLYDVYGCNEPPDLQHESQPRVAEESQIQRVSLKCIEQISGASVVGIAERILQEADVDPSLAKASPLAMQSLYHAATECQWYIREGHNGGMRAAFYILRQVLVVLNKRWRVAGFYLELLNSSSATS